MRDVEKVLADSRVECLRMITDGDTVGGRLSWYYTHMGEIDMAYQLGLIDYDRHRELVAEWETNKPRWTVNWRDN